MFTAEERRAYLGGSDAAAAAGWNKYMSRRRLYEDKLGLIPPFEGNAATYWGTQLEPFLRDHASRELGIKFRRSNKMFRDKEHPWMVAHVDGLGPGCGLECKTASFRVKKEFAPTGSTIDVPGEGLPIHYYCQVQWYQLITGRRLWYVVVGILGENDIRILEVPFHCDFAQELKGRCLEFWKMVENRTPPELELLSDIDVAYEPAGTTKEAGEHEMSIWTSLCALRKEQAELNERIKGLEGSLKLAMAEAEKLLDAEGRPLATWKATERKTLDTKALKQKHPELISEFERVTSSRVFKVLELDG